MKLGKVSKLLIFFTAWIFLTMFIMIKAYDAGYIAGEESATKTFLYILSH